MTIARTIGTCSLCGGPVTEPLSWMGVLPPVASCAQCGAKPKTPHGPVIEMVRPACTHPPPFARDGVCKACGGKT